MNEMMRSSVGETEKMEEAILPGFRFHPTDEELVAFYLKRKIQQRPLSIELIKQLDIYKYDPWDLPKLASGGEKEWYFYCPRDRKYRNSTRPNRVTGAGFWKATGTDRPIYSSDGASKCIGLKKSLVFYKGRAAKGVKTDWMMHEFRLPSLIDSTPSKRFMDKSFPPNDSWAICKIFKKANSTAQRSLSHSWVSPNIPTSTNNITNDTNSISTLNPQSSTKPTSTILQFCPDNNNTTTTNFDHSTMYSSPTSTYTYSDLTSSYTSKTTSFIHPTANAGSYNLLYPLPAAASSYSVAGDHHFGYGEDNSCGLLPLSSLPLSNLVDIAWKSSSCSSDDCPSSSYYSAAVSKCFYTPS